MTDPTEIKPDEFHPAARSAYRWLKGFMVNNSEDYLRSRTAIEMAAASGNRQAEICLGTIERLKNAQPVSDRYLLGLAWTILQLHNTGFFDVKAFGAKGDGVTNDTAAIQAVFDAASRDQGNDNTKQEKQI